MNAQPVSTSGLSEAVASAVAAALQEVQRFVANPPFQGLLEEMAAVPEAERAEWVRLVILDDAQLAKRGVIVPQGMVLQRSSFSDDRPTLFCVTKHLPPGLHWRKVTITFDNPSGEPAIRYRDVAAHVAL